MHLSCETDKINFSTLSLSNIIYGIVALIFICFLISVSCGYSATVVNIEAACLVLGIVGGVIIHRLSKGERDDEDRDYPRRF